MQFVLMDFAYGTGGTFLRSNDLEGELKLAGSVPEVSYVLGFSPQNQKMDGKYHTIKVTLRKNRSTPSRRGAVTLPRKNPKIPRRSQNRRFRKRSFRATRSMLSL